MADVGRVNRMALLAALGPLLDRALELPLAERDAWLASLRRDSPDLAHEVEALLAREQELDERGFLQSVPVERAPTPPQAGRTLGGYTLDRALGRGGMGTVWLAHRRDGRGEPTVAIKLLNPSILGPVGGERFTREASTLSRLTHPNVARLIEAGVGEGGHPYLVLEYVPGRRIDAYCDEERLTPDQRIDLFQHVLEAVAHVHANLIVHRDIKPPNILVRADGTVKLLDFGIAKLITAADSAVEHTWLSEALGSPMTLEFAAPEQISGEPVTTATDIYALGALLYILLAGAHPTSHAKRTRAERGRSLLAMDPPRLSEVVIDATGRTPEMVLAVASRRGATPEELQRRYAGDLDAILARALKKAPAERYGSATAFAEDIGRFMRGEPVRARAESLRDRAARFLRR